MNQERGNLEQLDINKSYFLIVLSIVIMEKNNFKMVNLAFVCFILFSFFFAYKPASKATTKPHSPKPAPLCLATHIYSVVRNGVWLNSRINIKPTVIFKPH